MSLLMLALMHGYHSIRIPEGMLAMSSELHRRPLPGSPLSRGSGGFSRKDLRLIHKALSRHYPIRKQLFGEIVSWLDTLVTTAESDSIRIKALQCLMEAVKYNLRTAETALRVHQKMATMTPTAELPIRRSVATLPSGKLLTEASIAELEEYVNQLEEAEEASSAR